MYVYRRRSFSSANRFSKNTYLSCDTEWPVAAEASLGNWARAESQSTYELQVVYRPMWYKHLQDPHREGKKKKMQKLPREKIWQTTLDSTYPCMGSLHAFVLSCPWHGLTVFLKDVLYHHVCRARVTPATPISEATLRHSHTRFVQRRACNVLWQHSRATKTTKSLRFHS